MSARARVRRFDRLLERAEEAYETQTRMMAQARAHYDSVAQQLEALEDYARQLGSEDAGARAQQVILRRQYLAQVFRAIEQQKAQLDDAQAQLQQAQLRWQEARAHREAVLKLRQQAQDEVDAALERAAQRQLDELSAWLHAQKE